MCVLCVRRTLANGRSAGVATGLGIATADAIFATIATLGLDGAARLLSALGTSLHVATAAVLVVLACRTLSTSHATTPHATSRGGVYASALALTLTNPATIVSFAALVVASAGVSPALPRALQTVAGVFAGSTAWWLLVTAAVSAFRVAPDARTMRTIDILSALVFLAFAAVELRRIFS
jgi:threonine/homoserine/homoserine lactone efflux protein